LKLSFAAFGNVVAYKILIKPSAGKEIEAIGAKKDRQRIVARILALANEPRPVGCDKLAGAQGRYRIRQGQFRIVYAVDDASRTVEVVKVGHRREVYRGAA
jgi:mRNA interferase RelE/StbE